jgi:hypothetical protein
MSIASLFALAAAALPAQAPVVDVESLLQEMTDLERLTRRQTPAYMAAQASSYDRASKDPDTEWFANADFGQYVRVEERDGRKEFVLADLQGPGAVVRIWSANPQGMLRFYFDGEESPRLAVKMADLLTGRIAPLDEPFGYVVARGTNLYFPLPYSEGLKITVDASDGAEPGRLYYHVGFRTYEPGTRVRTFERSDFDKVATSLPRIAAQLQRPEAIRRKATHTSNASLSRGSSTRMDISASEPSAIRELRIRVRGPQGQPDEGRAGWESPQALHNVLRTTILSIAFDGEETVKTPVGDFFGAAPGLNPYHSLPMEVRPDGWMICRFVMPFREEARILLDNRGTASAQVEIEAVVEARPWSDDTYYFRALWSAERGRTRPFRDMPFLNASGEGLLVGSHLHVSNPVNAWWGEGDEKIYVDGEIFPSTFGTGTEDYYGYAWCCPDPFMAPYHAQPRADGPANRGHTSNNRWHIFDPIPFQRSLRFDMEMWHWADVDSTFAWTTYWYAAPGSSGPVELKAELLLPPWIEPPARVPGAIEGEKLMIAGKTGGVTETQAFAQLSGEEQLWWRHMEEGDKLTLRLPVAVAGRYEISGNFCMAPDYGIHVIRIEGQEIAPIDFYHPTLKWEVKSLGQFDLPAGEAIIEVISRGRRKEARPGNMFGIDYLKLERVSASR